LWADRAGYAPSSTGYAHQLWAGMFWSSLPWLARLEIPTLIVVGDDDPLVPVSNALMMAVRMPSARVFVGEGDAWIVAGRYPSHANPGFYRDCWWRPSGIGFLAHSSVSGGAKYRPIGQLEDLREDRILDVPGRPLVIRTPGHTAGHYSVALPERGVLLAGDALANYDYATGSRTVGLHRFNDDRQLALASLSRLDGIDAETVLFGHGDPWAGGVDGALELARAAARN
jgi:glyoxylase-like metal-dependent hydrolase (beta-lactamase superfamily II)